MMEWILVVAAVGSNAIVMPYAGIYPTEEQCREAARQVSLDNPGLRYGVCKPRAWEAKP